MNETLFTIIKYTMSILVLVVFRYLIPFVNVKLKEQKYAGLLEFINKAVNAAESIYKLIYKSGAEKKKYVNEKIKEYVVKNHIDITGEQIDLLIEAIVNELNGVYINTNK